MSNEVLSAIEASNRAFAQFKGSIDERLDALERRDAKEHNRPRNGGSTILDLDTKVSPELKAWDRYLRTGDATELKSLDIVNAAEGGYGVPKVIDAAIERLILQQSPIRQYANVVQTTTGDFHKLVSLRGFVASWMAETAARPETTAGTFADVAPPSGDLYANPMASQQMLDDVFFDAKSWITSELADAFTAAESDAFINGSGTNRPKGFLTYTAVSTDDTSRAFGQIQYIPTGAAGAFATVSATVSPFDVLNTTVASMRVGYRSGCRWYMSPSTLATLANVKDTIGRQILIPSVTAGTPAMLVGYPVVECEHMPAIAANSLSIAFANMQRAYLITDRIGTRVLVDPFSNKPYVGMYATRRTGGAVQNSQAIKLIKFAVS
jgi:HK97 family phage major capsid protein